MTRLALLHARVLFVSLFGLALLGGEGAPASEPATAADSSGSVLSLDGPWRLAIDPANVGREQSWWTAPRAEVKDTRVPWIIQDAFPGYHGVAWYYREFDAPANPNPDGRTLLRFWQVDYRCEAWLNDVPIGSHDGAESPFVLDVTKAVRPGARNRLAVRVLNPTNRPIDGVVLDEIPHRNKVVPYGAGSSWDQGGICDSVEFLLVPRVRLEDLFVRPDLKTGEIRVRLNLRNAATTTAKALVRLSVAPGRSGETLAGRELEVSLAPGDTVVETTLAVKAPHPWNLDDPYLYRVTARVSEPSRSGVHEDSVRCGFRDFRFADGAFRLNGKRIYLRCSHTGNSCPVGLEMPHDPDYLRRDLINQKMLRFNMIRFISGVPKRYQLDMADEIGLMVYSESYAGWLLGDSPKMAERFDESVLGMVRRDRNHPSITMWGLLNETVDGPVFRHAVSVLPALRKLDDSRVVMLNSGRFDRGGQLEIEVWRGSSQSEPCVTRNATGHVVQGLGITWQPGQLAFHPGPHGEYAVVRWTAPTGGRMTIAAAFRSIAEAATTDVHLLHNGKPLFDGAINVRGKGPEASFHSEVVVKPGDTIDAVCGYGNGFYGADTTALDVRIRSDAGMSWDAAAGFGLDTNPRGVWSYGSLRAGERPESATFALLDLKNGPGAPQVGSISNPGSTRWEDVLDDLHPYQRVPHIASVIRTLRTIGGDRPVWLSEYGIGSAMDLPRTVRWFEQIGKAENEDAKLYRSWHDRFRKDWESYQLPGVFARPEDFFTQAIARMGRERLEGINAIRANPKVIGHSLTGTVDQGMSGEGVWTTFRELKPGATDALFDAWAPLRWCLFAEPRNAYRKAPVHLEAVLANEDVLAPGYYPVRLQVVGPELTRVFEKTVNITVADPKARPEPPMVQRVFAVDVVIDGPPGEYRFLATFEKGAAACGEEIRFLVHPARGDLPKVEAPVVVLGEDPALAPLLKGLNVRVRGGDPIPAGEREVILVSGKPAGDPAAFFRDLFGRIDRGASAVILTPAILAERGDTTGTLPLRSRGRLAGIDRWLYHADEWCRRHAVFDGLPSGGLLDDNAYRDLIPDRVFMDIEPPAEALAGSINASITYQSGLLLGLYKHGRGEFLLNALPIRDRLGTDPVADRLLVNFLRHAARPSSPPR